MAEEPICLRGLVELLFVAQKTHVSGKFGGGLSNSREDLEHGIVRLAGVGLPADVLTAVKTHAFHDHLLEPEHLARVPVEQLEEAGGRAGRAFAAQRTQLGELKVQLANIEQKIVEPKTGALSHRGRLGRLKMRVGQRALTFPALRKGSESLRGVHKQPPDMPEPVAHIQDIRIVAHIAACGAKVDDGARRGAEIPESEHMSHHIVTDFMLIALRGLIVDIRQMRAHLAELFVGDGQTQRLLAFGKQQPQPPPG